MVASFVGCGSNPYDMKLSEFGPEMADQLDGTEMLLVTAYMLRTTMAGIFDKNSINLDTVTVGMAIADQKAFQEQKAAEAEARKVAKILEKTRQESLKKSYQVTDLSLSYHDRRFMNFVSYTANLMNTDSVKIKAIALRFEFVDTFEDALGSVRSKFEQPLAPSDEITICDTIFMESSLERAVKAGKEVYWSYTVDTVLY